MAGSRGAGSPPAARLEAVYPLTPMQQGMLFHSLLRPGGGSYVVQLLLDLQGPLDRAAMRRAWQVVTDRHPVLRTAFPWDRRERPLQAVLAHAAVPWAEADWSALDTPAQAACLDGLLADDRRRGFDLKRAPLLRVTLIRQGRDRHLLVWSVHHLLLDGWSSSLVLDDLARAYAALLAGRPPALDPSPPFQDFVRWLGRRDPAAEEAFWRRELASSAGALPLVLRDLPAPHAAAAAAAAARPPGTAACGEVQHEAPDDMSAAVGRLATSCRLTESAIVLGAFCVLLSRYGRARAVTVGVTVAGRPPELAGVERMVGLFINTLPLAVEVDDAAPVDAWLGRLQERSAALQAFAASSLPEVRQWAGLPAERRLFEQIFVFENYPDPPGAPPDLGGLRLGEMTALEQPDQPLTLVAAPGRRLRLRALFDRASFTAPPVARLLGHLESLLRQMAASPAAPLGTLELLAAAERLQILAAGRGARRAYPRDTGLAGLFAAQAARRGDAPALVESVEGVESAVELSYRTLAARADVLAGRLRELGTRPGDRVAVLLERGSDFLAAILAILQCGAAYVPLDPAHPAERLLFMLGDCAARALVAAPGRGDAQGRGAAGLVLPSGCRLLELEPWPADTATAADVPIAGSPSPGGLAPAYLMYTSGSAGTPKGTVVTQQAVARLVLGTDYLDLPPAPRVAFASNVSFDASTLEIWAALLHGGTLVTVDRATLLAPAALRALLRPAGSAGNDRLAGRGGALDLLWLTAGWFHELARQVPDAFAEVGTLLCGGEAVDASAVRAVRAAGAPRRLLDGYGPTENTTFTTTYDTAALPPAAAAVPIGRPIANGEAFVLDPALRLLPAGVVGELCAGGDGLAIGYHARPDLTAERFVPHPFAERPGERLYRTGDLVRLGDGANLEILGRLDSQLKVRGFRVEPGEVEALLARHPGVERSIVVAHDGGALDRRLVAYVVGRGLPPPDDLRAWLARRLPDHMVPAVVMELPELPLTPHGKVDRRALPAPPGAQAADLAAALGPGAPLSPSIELLAGIWQQVLGVPAVGPDDDFFARGGHSLLATVAVSRIRAAFGVELPLHEVFDAPVLRHLAARIDAARRRRDAGRDVAPPPPVTPARRDRPLPLSFAQERLWFLDRFAPLSAAYHIPHALRLAGSLDAAALRQALEEIVRRHEALRTVFAAVDGQPFQRILPAWRLPLPEVDLSGLFAVDREAALSRHLERQFETPFDLAHGPLLRLLLVRLDETRHVLAIVLHHIVADGWSVGLFAAELAALYGALRRAPTLHEAPASPAPPRLPALPVQYADFALWQRTWLSGAALESQLDYWQERLAGHAGVQLPTDRRRPPAQSFRGLSLPVELPPALASAAAGLARREDCTLYMVLLASFLLLLQRHTDQDDLVVGTSVANRTQTEIEPLIGFFVNMLPLRADLAGEPTFARLLAAVRTLALDAFDHQHVPLAMLVERLRPQRDASRQPLFQITFAVDDLPGGDVTLPGLELGEVRSDLSWVRFDLELHLWRQDGGLRGYWAFAADLFDAATIARLGRHHARLLESALAAAERRIGSFTMLAEDERRQILWRHNATTADLSAAPAVHEGFLRRAASHPDLAAAVLDADVISYGELARRARRLAWYLRSRGAAPETRVALLLERSFDLVTAMLATVLAGAAYVPVDPTYPRARIAELLRGAAPVLAVSHRQLAAGLALDLVESHRQQAAAGEAAPCELIDLDQLPPLPEPPPDASWPASHPLLPVYVIFTSGSTGRPKGVVVSHGALANHMAWMQQRFPLRPGDRVLQKTGVTFDASVWELWAPLLTGTPLVLARPGLHADPRYLVEALAEQGISTLQMVPSVLELLVAAPGLEACTALRQVFIGGEALTWQLARRLRRRLAVEVVNLYGPAEVTVDATYAVWLQGPDKSHTSAGALPAAAEAAELPASIGGPIANLRAHVLDRRLEPLPCGAPGELYLGGAGLARGYLRRPAETAARFLPDPHGGSPGARLYRTGDLARLLPDGQIEYLGRLDRQVKIRGQRVELEEIEQQLIALPEVAKAVVQLRPDGDDKRLVAYVVPAADEPEDAVAPTARGEVARVDHWRSLYEGIYGGAAAADPTFDTTGWNSSYTGEPLPAGEMWRWRAATVARIFDLRPRRVLEIGCGTGLILFAVAPHVESYLAADFSPAVMARLGAVVAERGLRHVELLQRQADDLADIPAGCFDTVILNSVVQYFPSLDYLLRVLHQAVAAAAPGGAIFLGDVRSLPLLAAFHASVEVHHLRDAPPETRLADLARRVESQRRREEELLLDPALFPALRQLLPRLREVSLQIKRGGDANELTRFRYDVVLRLDRELPRPPGEPLVIDGGDGALSPAALGRLLAVERPAAVRLTRLANPRLRQDLDLLACLAPATSPGPPLTLGELRARLAAAPDGPPDPEIFWRLGEQLGYEVEVGWALDGSGGEMEVRLADRAAIPLPPSPAAPAPPLRSGVQPAPLLRPGVEPTTPPLRPVVEPPPPLHPGAVAATLAELANDPLRGRWNRMLAPRLRRRLEQRLPAYMVPQAIVCLEALPLTANGKVDRAALPEPDRDGLVSRASFARPATAAERRLAELWSGLLEVERISLHDDFFALGGHSLMAVMLAAAIQSDLGVEVPVPLLFTLTTLAAQARFLEERSAGALPQAASVPVATVAGGLVARLNGSDQAPRVFCFPPLLGYGAAFVALGRRLDSHALWAFDFAEQEADPLGRYAALVDELQPEGDLVFLGYSAGGPVALEVAKLLERRGRRVSDLILLDAAVVAGRQVLDPAERAAVVEENLAYFETFIRADPELHERFLGGAARAALASRMHAYIQFLDRLEHHGTAAANVHLIRAAPPAPPPSEAAPRDGRRDWRQLVTGEVRIYQGAGRHEDMVTDAHVDANAALVAAILDGLAPAAGHRPQVRLAASSVPITDRASSIS